MDPRYRIPYGTGGQTVGDILAADPPRRQPSGLMDHLNAAAGVLDHYTLGLPAALAGLNPFGGGYAAAREAADRGRSDAVQLGYRDLLALPEAFGGMVPGRIPQAPADTQAIARSLAAGGRKADDLLTAGVRAMPEGVGSMGGAPPRIRPDIPTPHPDGPRDLHEEVRRMVQQSPPLKPVSAEEQAAQLEALRRRFDAHGDAGLKPLEPVPTQGIDDKLIEIIRKYGLLPAAVGGSLMAGPDTGSAAP